MMAEHSARDVEAMLRRHYLPDNRPPGVMFLPEAMSPDGKRRIDVLIAGVTQADRRLVGHEIKVSRADLLAELKDPTKHDPWSRYCHRWWLVVSDPALVDGLDLPDWWGVMAPPSGRRTRSMTIVRPAPDLKPSDAGDAWQRIAITNWNRMGSQLDETTRELDWRKRNIEQLEEELRTLRASTGVVDPGRNARNAQALLDAISDVTEDGIRVALGANPTEVAHYLRDRDRARHALRALQNEVRRLANSLRTLSELPDRIDDVTRRLPAIADDIDTTLRKEAAQ